MMKTGDTFVIDKKIMIQRIFNQWNFMRAARLVMGIAILVQAYLSHDWMLAFAGILFTAMPLFNIGCCASGGCSLPLNKNNQQKETTYEEVV
jgi:hypothetical protein